MPSSSSLHSNRGSKSPVRFLASSFSRSEDWRRGDRMNLSLIQVYCLLQYADFTTNKWYKTCAIHSLSYIRDVWVLRQEATLIFFRILIVFIPYFIPYFYKNFSSLCPLNAIIHWKIFLLKGKTFSPTPIMVYNGRGEIGLVLAANFFAKKTSPGRKFESGH